MAGGTLARRAAAHCCGLSREATTAEHRCATSARGKAFPLVVGIIAAAVVIIIQVPIVVVKLLILQQRSGHAKGGRAWLASTAQQASVGCRQGC